MPVFMAVVAVATDWGLQNVDWHGHAIGAVILLTAAP